MDLMTCPFCMSRNIMIQKSFYMNGNFYVECGNCKARGPLARRDKKEAIRHWNKQLFCDRRDWAKVERFIE